MGMAAYPTGMGFSCGLTLSIGFDLACCNPKGEGGHAQPDACITAVGPADEEAQGFPVHTWA